MCGIAGVWNWKTRAPVDPELLSRMISRLAHRGPDEHGMHLSEEIGLVHSRLSIVDLATGQQPMSNEDGSLWVVFNGEIYNHPELRGDLLKTGHRFKTTSDTEVILHLYEEKGVDCVHSFNGQFAFALWDEKRKRLFLVRDRMGVRPLFYAFHEGRLLFASEIKALFADPSLPRKLDLQALDQVFTFWFPVPPRSGFVGVEELPPGNWMLVDANGGIQKQQYWKMEFPSREEFARGNSHPDQWYAEELRVLLDDAVRIRLRADVPVAAYLSGGLDSSVTTALAQQHIQDNLKTFSIGFESVGFDESAHQSKVVDHLGTEHHPFFCRNAQVGTEFARAVWHMERPVVRTAPVPMMLLSKGVRQAGIKVVLTGEGSDEILAGYDIFKEAKIRRFWASHPDSHLRPLLLRRLYPYLSGIQGQSSSFLRAFFRQGLENTADPFYSHRLRWQVAAGLKGFYSPGTRELLGTYDPIAELRDQLPRDYASWDPLSQAQYLETIYLLPGYLLSSQGDRMGMANSVEGRFPFLDPRVVEFATRIPPSLRMRRLREKHILREAMQGLLSAEILDREKQPYRAPDHAAFFPEGKTLDYVGEILSEARIQESGFFSSSAVQALVAKACRQPSLGTRDGMALVGILSTQLLYEQFVQGNSPT